ncbi:MAG TPA: HDIG domain-containing protein [Candidatus Limnocylindrales bacterium]|nr:HDIG domain-containing protein [Candidatus Limnocylindrales bacterium]
MFIPRTLTEAGNGPNATLWRAFGVGAVIAAGLFLILSANITVGQEDLEAGQVATRDIRAPRDATFDSVSETDAAREAAAEGVQPVTELLEPPADNQEDQLNAFDMRIRRVTRILEQRDDGSLGVEEVSARLATDVPEISVLHRELLAGMSVPRWEVVATSARAAIESTLAGSIREDELLEVRRSVRDLITNDLADEERDLAGDMAADLIEPNVVINDELTEEARNQARANVPPVQVEILSGETIVAEGQRLTVGDIEKLEELGLTRPRVQVGTVIGNALIATLVSALLVGYLLRFEPEIWHRNRSVLLFFLALVVTAVAIRIAADRTLWAFAVPTSATVLLIGILLRNSAGAAMAVALAVLTGVMNRDALEPAVFVLAGGMAALLTITLAERLNAFVRVFAALAVTNIAVVTAFSLLGQRDLAAVLQLGGIGLVNALLSVFLAVGSFALLGNVFGIMTVFQLLELANPSNRLLRRLLLETPGTYHHSVMVGNLAERAAETIGADPLLARVAAYYHDIGKMKNPLAFIENQAGARNIHDDLNAETSARIIAGHIRDGIDLGYEHGLPVQVIGYIPQHHGTSVMTYFHQKALREVGGREDLVDERSYRYPGPKPQTREAAIIMLADGVEASVRSLDEKDEESIRAMVDRIVDARVEDGQLDDAELTLKNISQIKDAFVGQLLGMYHSRIKYPDNVVPMDQRREQA